MSRADRQPSQVDGTATPADPQHRAQMRNRLTGGIFIAALAVIVLPMLFDGEGLPPVQVAPITQEYTPEPVEPLADLVPESAFVEEVDAFREEVDSEGFSAATGTRVGEPVLAVPSDATSVWAVQAGSFADADNAAQFQQQLRDAGLEAFMSTARNGGVVRVRVGVGPFLAREEAAGLVTRLRDEFEVEAQLKEFKQ